MSVKNVGQLIITVIALICVVGFVCGFFYTIFNASRWECKKYIPIKVMWVDAEESPSPRYTTRPYCVEYER